ncbi:MAG: NifU family protein [Candidatus Kapabacteria bacterium]|nr:NifU family protein [Candidatus Kapabacteria bacterium]
MNRKIQDVIEKDIKGFIESDGGKIKFMGYEGGIVKVRLSGSCAHCSAIDYTLKGGIEKILQMQLPEVKAVELV